jgi:membrane-bound metal-dependent hydrolase YbcI (DUF457 family)
MSGYITHMTVGAAGGLALARLGVVPGDPALLTLALPAASAIAATWPDLDHPDAWASQRAGWVTGAMGVLGAALGALPALGPLSPGESAAVLALGGLCGLLLGALILWGLRRLAGGHRGGTHGLVSPAMLLVVAALLGLPWAWLPLLLAWGWGLHIVADVVTPGGWRPLAPWRGPVVRLPRWLTRHGETMVMGAALAVLALGLGLSPWLAPVVGGAAAVTLAARRRARGWR